MTMMVDDHNVIDRHDGTVNWTVCDARWSVGSISFRTFVLLY